MTDSSSTDGWLHRSNFNDEEETNLQTGEKLVWARNNSTRMLDNTIKEYLQWFLGKENEVTDYLSRDDHICDQVLTSLLFSQIPEQMPHNFKLFPLSPVIESRFLAMLQRLLAATRQREAHHRSKIALGSDFRSSYKKSKSSMILSLTRSPTNTRSPFFPPSHKPFNKLSFLKLVSLPWLRVQSEVP